MHSRLLNLVLTVLNLVVFLRPNRPSWTTVVDLDLDLLVCICIAQEESRSTGVQLYLGTAVLNLIVKILFDFRTGQFFHVPTVGFTTSKSTVAHQPHTWAGVPRKPEVVKNSSRKSRAFDACSRLAGHHSAKNLW
eukprot:SAG11_NODE_143_length_14870_cov_6.472412_1_plen_135_part_00